MSRGRVVCLGLIGALLVLDGSSSAPLRAPDAIRATPAFDAARVSSILQRVNPSLSETQLERIGNAVVRLRPRTGCWRRDWALVARS